MTEFLEVRPRVSPLSPPEQCLKTHFTNHLLNSKTTYYFSAPDFVLDPERYRDIKK